MLWMGEGKKKKKRLEAITDEKTVEIETVSDSSSSDVELQVKANERSMFQSTAGIVVSCLGSAVGTGNIWRFPRILATHSYARGSLTFYIAWVILLFTWSMPIILVEYAIGRFTRNSAPVAYMKFLGKRFCWVGGWLVSTIFLLSGYYPVVVGWCLYYLFISVSVGSLPGDEEAGMEIFNNYVQNSKWPVFTQFLALLLSGIFLFGGIRWIEKANMVLVPLLLAIVVFTFGWSLTRDFAEVGIDFLFTPTWESLAMPGLWIAAAGQNAFDTGAGMSVLMTYAAFTGRSASITKYSIFIPLVNNLVSFYASITIFCTVFSTMIMTNPTITRAAIVRIMQTTGPGSTGLTFTWIPVLFSKVGILGRILCTLFFLCLAFAGVSSLLSEIQAYVLALKEMGVSHRIAVSGALIATFLIGIPSALSLEFLDNQDNTWGYALIICGFLLAIVVIIYRPLRFRRIIINEFGTNDWNAPIIWVPIITVLVPAIAIILIVWWIYDYIRADSHWYHLTLASVTSMILEWLILLVLLVGTNLLVYYCRRDFYTKARKIGCDPYDPITYEKAESLKLKEIKVAAVNGNGVVNRNES